MILKKAVIALLFVGCASASFAMQRERQVQQAAQPQELAAQLRQQKAIDVWGDRGFVCCLATGCLLWFPKNESTLSKVTDGALVTTLAGAAFCFAKRWVAACRVSRAQRKLDNEEED